MRFSPANAREMAARSAEARRNRHQETQLAIAIAPLNHEASETQAISPYANKLAYAQDMLLEELLTADCAKDKAALSQALKNLRETYHMATGAPKPGTIKPERAKSRQSAPRPSDPEPDTTTGGSPGQ